MKTKCAFCGKELELSLYLIERVKNNYCNHKCYTDHKRSKNPTYRDIHKWLNRVYGKPRYCENKKCINSSDYYHWALKKRYKYERRRSNFIRLCASCHGHYDKRTNGLCWNKEKRKWKASIRLNNKNKHIGYYSNKKLAEKESNRVWEEYFSFPD